jgi:hypothetical protein
VFSHRFLSLNDEKDTLTHFVHTNESVQYWSQVKTTIQFQLDHLEKEIIGLIEESLVSEHKLKVEVTIRRMKFFNTEAE